MSEANKPREWTIARDPILGRLYVYQGGYAFSAEEPPAEVWHVREVVPGSITLTREQLWAALLKMDTSYEDGGSQYAFDLALERALFGEGE